MFLSNFMPTLAQLPSLLTPGQRYLLSDLQGAADAYLLAHYAQQHLSGKQRAFPVFVIICAQASDAQRLVEEIPYFAPELRVRLLPDWETLPYDNLSPHQDLISERLATLQDMRSQQCDVVILSASTALLCMAPPGFLAAHTFFFNQGQQIDETALKQQLRVAGYDPVSAVMRPGEYSVRGGLIDIFPMGSTLPYRLDLFGNEIDKIRAFDPDTQRSLYPVKEIRLLPGREFPLDENSCIQFRQRWREAFEGDPSRVPLYRDIANGVAGAGIEYYLPLFFEHTSTFFDHLASLADQAHTPAQLALVGQIDTAIEQFWSELDKRYQFLSKDSEKPLLPPQSLFLNSEQFFSCAKPYARLVLKTAESTLPINVAIDRRATDPLAQLKQFAQTHAVPILLCADSPGRRETLKQLLHEAGLRPNEVNNFSEFINHPSPLNQDSRKVILARHTDADSTQIVQQEGLNRDFEQHAASLQNGLRMQAQTRPASATQPGQLCVSPISLSVAPLHAGFALHENTDRTLSHWLITEAELYTDGVRRSRRRQERASNIDTMVRDLVELKIGDPVVHSDHGIGRYRGLISMDLGQGLEEFLHLEYAQNALLYVPVHQLSLISRYSGADPESAPLHQLGSGQWDKAKRKAALEIRDTAAELLNLYARRALRQGHAFDFSARDYENFAASFGFEETPDQAAAIAAVIADMTSGKPMDRLVCGDVGFGKTEVALRAAFIGVMGNKQVALLAPTTLLAEQHFQTFSNRFADWPVKIVELSRFKSKKEIASALEAIKAGQADIVIGTHKLLSSDLHFPHLGLVIVDEEHRFGVRQKEALKTLRAEVDMLTLTATPIPRTLGMALEGLRDFSVIATAPQKRLAIKTFVQRESDSIIREAILRELKRGGQVYFLHNEVDTINNRLTQLNQLIPEAHIGIAHGQMPERELEHIMRDFVAQRFNVLLCTTIIETGIDVPSANTIVMHRADKFGLAQLHQLRGRVGRSHHQAYAYLLVPDPEGLTQQAKRRLEAIQAMEELGAGFYLAMHDLEIRGAGEVLGDKQSGDISQIGFQLYTDMLNNAVKSLKAGKEPDLMAPLAAITDINLGVAARLPDDYCPDVHERLSLYKRLASCEQIDDIHSLHEELVDRLGQLPETALALLEVHRLRLLTQPLGIRKIDANPQQIQLHFSPTPPIDPGRIIQLVQTHRHIQLAGQDKLKITSALPLLQARIDKIREVANFLKA